MKHVFSNFGKQADLQSIAVSTLRQIKYFPRPTISYRLFPRRRNRPVYWWPIKRGYREQTRRWCLGERSSSIHASNYFFTGYQPAVISQAVGASRLEKPGNRRGAIFLLGDGPKPREMRVRSDEDDDGHPAVLSWRKWQALFTHLVAVCKRFVVVMQTLHENHQKCTRARVSSLVYLDREFERRSKAWEGERMEEG